MSNAAHWADQMTVITPSGERKFTDVYAEVIDGVLTIRRESRVLSWFAAGQWTEANFL